MEQVAPWASDPVKVMRTEYAKAVGRLSTCVRKTRWSSEVKELERLRQRLKEIEEVRTALEQAGQFTRDVVANGRRHFGGDGSALVEYARALSKRGLVEEAARAIAQLGQFEPEMAALATILSTSHQQPEEAMARLQDLAVDPEQPLRVRLLAMWWLATSFRLHDFCDDLIMSLLSAALRESRWEAVKRIFGAARSIIRMRTGEATRWGEEEDSQPDFRMEFEQLRHDLQHPEDRPWEAAW